MGEVWAIYVLPEYWGVGIGNGLLAATLTQLRTIGKSDCSLWVLKQNTRAIRFYESAGFRLNYGSDKTITLGGHEVVEQRLFSAATPNRSIKHLCNGSRIPTGGSHCARLMREAQSPCLFLTLTTAGPPARSPAPARRRRIRGPGAAVRGGRSVPGLRCRGRTRARPATAWRRGRDCAAGQGSRRAV